MSLFRDNRERVHIQKNQTRKVKKRYCIICGKMTQGGRMCDSCSEFIQQKNREERARHDNR